MIEFSSLCVFRINCLGKDIKVTRTLMSSSFMNVRPGNSGGGGGGNRSSSSSSSSGKNHRRRRYGITLVVAIGLGMSIRSISRSNQASFSILETIQDFYDAPFIVSGKHKTLTSTLTSTSHLDITNGTHTYNYYSCHPDGPPNCTNFTRLPKEIFHDETNVTTTTNNNNMNMDNNNNHIKQMETTNQRPPTTGTRHPTNGTNTRYHNTTIQSKSQNQNQNQTNEELLLGPIFYNFFVPINRTIHALTIATEQMNERQRTAPNATLWYTLIGNPSIKDDFCQPNCRMRQYLERGDEVDTYQALWEYCQQHPHQIITYTHDRGSFHDTWANMKSRRFGTKAALECRRLMIHHRLGQQCNVCTSKFWVVPQYLASANMWSARCSYVRFLLAPNNYSATMQSMYDQYLLHPNKSEAEYACLKPQSLAENHLGLNRYAPERWIFSHPYVRPCDVLPMPLGRAPSTFPQTWTPQFRLAPTTPSGFHGMYKTSYSRLVGRLFEWQYVYAMVPPPHSWIWNHYKGKEDGTDDWLNECLPKTNTTREKALTTQLLRRYWPSNKTNY